MTMLCVPILADEPAIAKRDAILAAEKGADIVEFRVDLLMEARIAQIKDLVAESTLPCIVTCRPEWEGGLYAGGEDERVSMFEALGTADSPPAYIDVELKAYTASANIRQKINLAVDHPKQQRHIRTRLILSSHDFQGRPADLTRKILAMQAEPACAVVKVAYRARSIRDNLELFDILSERQKPTIALGMGEFGLMSRVLAPKFGGFLTFASLRDESATAPGQPTIDDLLGLYRFRSIGKDTKVYGVVGWPVAQSMSPLIHNSGLESIAYDGVYLPLPVEPSYESFKATLIALTDQHGLDFAGASVTIPHKEHLARFAADEGWGLDPAEAHIGALNTIAVSRDQATRPSTCNTDFRAIADLLDDLAEGAGKAVHIFGAGGVARAAVYAAAFNGFATLIHNRHADRAQALVEEVAANLRLTGSPLAPRTRPPIARNEPAGGIYINCTPLGMKDGPDESGTAIDVARMTRSEEESVFFDTVYNPIETPMLRAAKERGYRTIDGVQMFVRQAAAQFELWTGQAAPVELFDRLVRTKLGGKAG
jgi:3-dehydroquinate dehydratase/shikimate dehydrogenase